MNQPRLFFSFLVLLLFSVASLEAMVWRGMRYLVFLPVLLIACSPGPDKARTGRATIGDSLTFAMVKGKLLGREVGSLPGFPGYVSRDTTLEGDEGVSWKAKAYYLEQKLVFLAETSWEDAHTIRRITVLGPQVREGALLVDRPFKEMKGLVSGTIPTSLDGYLFLTYSKDSAISIELDISGEKADSRLFRGVSSIAEIPDTLRVESIVIQ